LERVSAERIPGTVLRAARNDIIAI